MDHNNWNNNQDPIGDIKRAVNIIKNQNKKISFKETLETKMNLYEVLKDNIVEKRHCILRSGQHSDTYIKKTKITIISDLYIEVIRQLSNEITKYFKFNEYDIITGPAVAGISFAAPVAIELKKPFIFPEKNFHDDINYTLLKNYKMKFRKEYEEILNSNKKVIIIEDIITTGGSVCKTAEAISKAGSTPKAVFCIWNRNPNKEFIKSMKNITLRFPIFSLISRKIDDWAKEECPICNK